MDRNIGYARFHGRQRQTAHTLGVIYILTHLDADLLCVSTIDISSACVEYNIDVDTAFV